MPKVFLSYSRHDSVFVDELYRRLTRDGVQCFYDQESIAWGSNWVRELEQGLKEADVIVLVLTPAFVESKWTELERTAALAAHPDTARRRIRPLLLTECVRPEFLGPIQPIDVTTTERFESNYPKICKDLGGTPRSDSLPAERSRTPAVAPLPPRHRIPYRSLGAGFAGRTAELWGLHDALTDHGVAVVAGLGGLGKTQLATEYAHRFAGFYPGGIFWTDAEQGIETVVRQIATAAEIQIDGKWTIDEQREHLYKTFAKASAPVLLIFDNVPESASMMPWLPVQSNIRALITTRRRDLTRLHALPLQPLEDLAGLELLNKGARRFGHDATDLVGALGGLPLALELARNFLNLRPELSVTDLIEEMGKLGHMATLQVFENNYRDQLPTGHIKEVGATFQLSWELASPAAQRALEFMAQLAPVSVPRFLLRQAFGSGDSALTDPIDTWITELARLSLVELDNNSDPRAHRLIGGFVASIPIDEDLRTLVINTLTAELARVHDDRDVRAYAELERILPHAEKIVQTHEITSAKAMSMLGNLARQHERQGRPRIAERLARHALTTAKRTFLPGHPSIAMRQSNLALVLKGLGELPEARDLLRAALAADERSFEPGHPTIATSQSNLGLVLKDLGELAEARDLLRAALAADERSFEPGHPAIATTQSNLALVLRDLGELAEARDLLRAALAADERSFEPGHPTIATSQSNLALVVQGLGELAEARDLLRAALATAERTFEPGHPTIAIRQSNLAMVLQDLGELAEARDLLRAALATAERVFEKDHPTIALRQSNLARVLKDLGELAEARDLLQAAYDFHRVKFGDEHPKTNIARKRLEAILAQSGSTLPQGTPQPD